MAANVVTPGAAVVTSALDTTFEQINGGVIKFETGKKDQKGDPEMDYKWVTEDDVNTVRKDNKYKDKPAEVIFTQSFKFPKPNTWDGFRQLMTKPDGVFVEEEAVNLAYNAIKSKANNKARAKVLQLDDDGNFMFSPVEGAIDLTPDILQLTNRRLDPQEKLVRDAEAQSENLSPEVRARLIAILMADQNKQ